MEMTDRLSTLPRQSQLKVMERVFQKLSLAYGNQFSEKWKGISISALAEDWADELANKSLGAIQFGLDKARKLQFPPNLGDFIECCSGYAPPAENNVYQIDHKLTPEQIEKNKARTAEIKQFIFEKWGRK